MALKFTFKGEHNWTFGHMWQIISEILYWEEILAWILLNVSVCYPFWSIYHEAKQPFHCLPAVLVCFRGSSVRTGSVALEGRPTPALLTAQTLNWYRLPSFSPNTGKWHIFWRCMLQRTHSPWLTSHLRKSWQKIEGNNKRNLLRRQRKTFIFGAPQGATTEKPPSLCTSDLSW